MAVAILIVESKYFDEEKATAEERDKRTKEKDLQNATHKEQALNNPMEAVFRCQKDCVA